MESEKQRIYYINIIKDYEQRIKELESQNERLISENNDLKEKWNRKFDDQATRTQYVVEIAKHEHENIYDDIINLINDKKRFSLDSLLEYSTSEWLSKQNPIIVKFLETLIFHDNNDKFKEEKLFKCAMTVEAIYGARHLKYVSAINLASSAIKYSIAKSKKIIDIDNHFLSSGGYNKFVQWQENLAGESSPLPNGLLFLAFDNEQKGQKNYLDHNYNTVTFHTVTSFLAFNFDTTDQTQMTKEPWLYRKLNSLQVEELFDVTPDMQRLLDQQLHNHLSIILNEACMEKNDDTNAIDDLATKHTTIMNRQKRCTNCGKVEIENSRRKCPDCNEKLANLSETQQRTQETINQSTNTTRPLNFKFYQNKTNISDDSTKPISITQKSSPQDGVEVPDLLVPDPLPINPNSIENVHKVLNHIQKISVIKKGERK